MSTTTSATPSSSSPAANATAGGDGTLLVEADFSVHAVSLVVLAMITVLLLVFVFGYVVTLRKIYWIGESQIAVVLGAIVGGFVRLANPSVSSFEFVHSYWNVLFIVLLPPIVFEGGFSMRRKRFFANALPTTLLAFVGTIISATFIGGTLYGLVVAGVVEELTALECALFGSLISATDPVAVLAILHTKDVDEDLYAVLFGESILNDAVAIVLYETIIRFFHVPEFTASNVAEAFGDFFLIFIVSVIIGVVIAVLVTIFFKYIGLWRYPLLETTIFVLLSLVPFLAAQGAGMSGIVATLFAAIVMAHYTTYNLSPISVALTKRIFTVVRMVAETFVFVFLGLEVFLFAHDPAPAFIGFSILLMLVGRALHVFPLLSLTNCCRRRERRFTIAKQFTLWFSGLRGAIAFALAVLASTNNDVIPHVNRIVTTTLIDVACTMFVLGGSVYFILKRLKLVGGDGTLTVDESDAHAAADALENLENAAKQQQRQHQHQNGERTEGDIALQLLGSSQGMRPGAVDELPNAGPTQTNTAAADEGDGGDSGSSPLSFVRLDRRYLKPLLTRDYRQRRAAALARAAQRSVTEDDANGADDDNGDSDSGGGDDVVEVDVDGADDGDDSRGDDGGAAPASATTTTAPVARKRGGGKQKSARRRGAAVVDVDDDDDDGSDSDGSNKAE